MLRQGEKQTGSACFQALAAAAPSAPTSRSLPTGPPVTHRVAPAAKRHGANWISLLQSRRGAWHRDRVPAELSTPQRAGRDPGAPDRPAKSRSRALTKPTPAGSASAGTRDAWTAARDRESVFRSPLPT